MPRLIPTPTELPSPAEVRERRLENEWLHREAEHRRPERNRGRSDTGDKNRESVLPREKRQP